MLHRMRSELGFFIRRVGRPSQALPKKTIGQSTSRRCLTHWAFHQNSFFSQPHLESMAFNVARVPVSGRRVGSLGSAPRTGVEELLLWNLRQINAVGIMRSTACRPRRAWPRVARRSRRWCRKSKAILSKEKSNTTLAPEMRSPARTARSTTLMFLSLPVFRDTYTRDDWRNCHQEG
jgi:hypothetical protein